MIKTVLLSSSKEVTIGISSFLLSLVFPIVGLLGLSGFLIFADTVTGAWAARVRGEEFHSSKLRRVLSKLLLYPLIIIIASWCEKLLPGISFIEGATVLIIVVELTSISENCSTILGINIFEYIKAFINSDLKSLVNKKKDEELK